MVYAFRAVYVFVPPGGVAMGVVGAKGGVFAWGRRKQDGQVSNNFLAGQARAGCAMEPSGSLPYLRLGLY